MQIDSISKYDYLRETSRYYLAKKNYIKLVSFYDNLDSTYFEFPIEREILQKDVRILNYNKEGEIKKRDSLISYMNNFFINAENHVDNNNLFQFYRKKRYEMRTILWFYEEIDLDLYGNLKQEKE